MRIERLSDGRYGLVSSYNKNLVESLKQIPGMSWDHDARMWVGYPDAMELVRREWLPKEPPFRGVRLLPRAYENADLRSYQQDGVDFLIAVSPTGALLADVMGAGKSAQALRAAKALNQRTLIVCPSFVRGVWESELKKWWPEASYGVLEGVKKTFDIPPWLVAVCHYDILYAWVDQLLAWRGGPLDKTTPGPKTLIFDEAHFLASEKARRSKAAKKLAHVATHRMALTGTPLTNRPRDLWNVVDTISPGRFGETFFKYGIRYCCPPESPIWMGDMSFKPIGEISVGDIVVGWKNGSGASGGGRADRGQYPRAKGYTQARLCRTRVIGVGRRRAPIVVVTMESGRRVRCTPDHLWLSGAHHEKKWPWTKARVGGTLSHVVDIPLVLSDDQKQSAAWLGGVFDGEGSASRREVSIAQSATHNPEVCNAIEDALKVLGFSYYRQRGGRCDHFRLLGGRQARLDFVLKCRPVRKEKIIDTVLSASFKKRDRIVSIEPDGEGEVVSLTTETGNYVVWGYASKNCDGHQIEIGHGADAKIVWDWNGRSNLEELRQRLSFMMLRRTHQDIQLELPTLTRQVVELKIPSKFRVEVPLGSKAREVRKALDLSADGKLKEVVAMCRQHVEDGHKVVVFCHRRGVAEHIAQEAGQEPALTAYIHGGISQRFRDTLIEQQRRDDGPCLLVATIDVSQVGIDLSFADVVVFAELTWEPHELAQAEARVYRFGATKPILVQYCIGLGTADELIRDKVLNKVNDVLTPLLGKAGNESPASLVGDKTDDEALAELWAAI